MHGPNIYLRLRHVVLKISRYLLHFGFSFRLPSPNFHSRQAGKRQRPLKRSSHRVRASAIAASPPTTANSSLLIPVHDLVEIRVHCPPTARHFVSHRLDGAEEYCYFVTRPSAAALCQCTSGLTTRGPTKDSLGPARGHPKTPIVSYETAAIRLQERR